MRKILAIGVILVVALSTFSILALQIASASKPGDLNGDGVVDGKDLIIVAKALGSYPGHPRWNPIADVNLDNEVNGADMVIVAKNFGH
jgi:hypothetical protein